MDDVWLEIQRQRSAVKLFWRVAGGLAVLMGSFWTTLVLMDWMDAAPPVPTEIKVMEATYGANCVKTAAGNATTYAAKICDAASSCLLPIDVSKMGDPAPGCGKDFAIKYSCLRKTGSHSKALPGEANGKTLRIDCDES